MFHSLSGSDGGSPPSGGDGGGNHSRPSSSSSTAKHKQKNRRITASPDVGTVTDGVAAMSPSDETPTGDGTNTGGANTGGIASLGFTPVNDFNHPAKIVSDVILLLQSISNNSTYYERRPSHHANGIDPPLRSIMNNPNRGAMIADVLKDFCPEILMKICMDGYDCNRTSEEEEIQLRDKIHNDVFSDTLSVIGCGYKKSVSGLVGKWKEVEALVENDLDGIYSEDLRIMVVKALETIEELGLMDGDVYTLPYIGESAYMTFTARAVDGKYPDMMYELAGLLGTTVVETKVSSATAFDKKHSLFNEAFLACLMMAATDRSRGKRGAFEPCKILLFDGTGCNRVRAGVRDHHYSSRYTSRGEATNIFFMRNYNHYGEVEVMSDTISVENLARGTTNEELRAARSFVTDFEEHILQYIADPVRREKTGRTVIDARNHQIRIRDACQFWGYYNGTKNVELGRGIFSEVYLEIDSLARQLVQRGETSITPGQLQRLRELTSNGTANNDALLQLVKDTAEKYPYIYKAWYDNKLLYITHATDDMKSWIGNQLSSIMSMTSWEGTQGGDLPTIEKLKEERQSYKHLTISISHYSKHDYGLALGVMHNSDALQDWKDFVDEQANQQLNQSHVGWTALTDEFDV